MNILLQPNNTLFWTALLGQIGVLLAALYYAPWRALLRVNGRQHALLGAILALALFWQLRVEVDESLAVHPLAITTLTIIFGWSLAIISGTLACGLSQFGGDQLWLAWPVDSLLAVTVPACITWLVLQVIERIRQKNLFVYMLGAGFFGAMFSVLSCGAVAIGLFWLSDSQQLLASANQYFYVYALLMLPEGFINGAMVSVTTVLWPHMVKTYDDHFYLDQ